jgi:hypothetical protein
VSKLYVHVPFDVSTQALPHCEAALDHYLTPGAIWMMESTRTELENLRNEFRAMQQQLIAGTRVAEPDPLLL